MSSTAEPNANTGLNHYLWLSLGAAITTLGIKAVAAWLTNSVSLWSDALESTVNLVAAIIAIWALRISVKPADHNHQFGHGKAEYVSAGVEGSMVFVAAGAIIISAIGRLFTPTELESLTFGLALSLSASVINLAVGWSLVRAGKKNRSITLEADGKHLLTDVITSAGVLVGIGLVLLTGWTILDPIVALLVGANILFTGFGLIKRSVVGLLDSTLPPAEVEIIAEVVSGIAGDPRVHMTELKTRESGRQRFVYATMSVPGHWTIRRAHDVADAVEAAVDEAFAGTTTFVHIEPNDEPPTDEVPLTR